MAERDGKLLAAKILKWIARVWSILVALVVIMIMVVPDAYAVRGPTLEEAVILSFSVLAALALLFAWKWPLWGGIASIAFVLAQIIGFRLNNGVWMLDFNRWTLQVLPFVIPAILFIISWYLSRRQSKKLR